MLQLNVSSLVQVVCLRNITYFPYYVDDKCRISKYSNLAGIRTLTEMIEHSHHQTLFIQKNERKNIDKTLEGKRRWSSQSFSDSGVDYARGMY